MSMKLFGFALLTGLIIGCARLQQPLSSRAPHHPPRSLLPFDQQGGV